MSDQVLSQLTSGRRIVRNTFLNLVGQGAPLLVAFFAIPLLINDLGTERFGILTLAWMIIGYFSIFDLGLGRTLTKLVAERVGAGKHDDLPALIWTASLLMLILGLTGTIILTLLTPWLIEGVLNFPKHLRDETVYTFYLLALSIPIVISTTGFRGVLEALQRFDLVNVVRIPLGVFTFVGPLLVLPFSRNLFNIVTVLIIGRVIAWLIHLTQCLYVMPTLRNKIVFKCTIVKPLIRFGSWITISNLISPLMVYLDRFLISALISVTAVAYYTTPYEVVTKLLIIPGALAGVLFPTFSATFTQNRDQTALIFSRGVKLIFFILFPIILFIVVFAKECLLLWLDFEFSINSFRVMQLLSLGVLINAMASIPYALIQGVGRPDITAKLHLIELPIYLGLVVYLIDLYGIEGAALAWLLRVSIDALMLMLYAVRIFPEHRHELYRVAPKLILILMSLVVLMFNLDLIIKLGVIVVVFILYSLSLRNFLANVNLNQLLKKGIKVSSR